MAISAAGQNWWDYIFWNTFEVWEQVKDMWEDTYLCLPMSNIAAVSALSIIPDSKPTCLKEKNPNIQYKAEISM